MRSRRTSSIKFCTILFILFLINNTVICNVNSTLTFEQKSHGDEFVTQSSDSYKILNVPYEDMIYDVQFGDAGACLSMLDQYYGGGVPKLEINGLVDADYSGGGISEEGLIDAATYDDYSNRDYGYYIDIVTLDGNTYEERWSYIKGYIDKDIPLIMISKLYPNYPTHHRVIFGYDDREEVLYLHDPWAFSVDPIYQGPKSIMSIQEGSWLDVQWFNNKYTLAIVRSIDVSLSIDTGAVTSAGIFTLDCTFDNSFMDNFKDIRLQVSLPESYSIIDGNAIIDIPDFIGTTSRSWNISCPVPTENDLISVKAFTTDGTTSYGGIDEIFPAHPQPFICNISSNYLDDITPYKTNITMDLDCSGDITATLHSFSLLPNLGASKMNTSNSEIVFETSTKIKCITGPNEPNWTVFCWYKVTTIYGSILSPIVVIYSYDTDMDTDEISDFEEETIYNTDPSTNDTDKDRLTDYDEIFVYKTNASNADTDGDRMNDFDEIAQGFDPLDPKSSLFRRNLVIGLSVSLPVVVLSASIAIYFIIKKKRSK